MPTTLNDLINAIPVAGRGDVISPESHNTLRAALVVVAAQLGATPAGGATTITFAPALLPMQGETAWDLGPGVAQKSAASNATAEATGWLPLQLPAGALIQSLLVVAGRTGPASTTVALVVRLQRQFINGDGGVINLINLNLFGAAFSADLVQAEAPYAPAGLPPDQVESARRVDNDQYKYFLRVELRELPAREPAREPARASSVARLHAVRVTFRT